MKYSKHLAKNWKVAGHALTDFFAHFIHGLLPFIKIKHHEPTPEASPFEFKLINKTIFEPVTLQAEVCYPNEFVVDNPEILDTAKERLFMAMHDGLIKNMDLISYEDKLRMTRVVHGRIRVLPPERGG